MPKLSPLAPLLLAALAAPLAASAAEPVFVRGTLDGAYVRLPHVRPTDVSVDQPDPRRLVITARPADFSTGANQRALRTASLPCSKAASSSRFARAGSPAAALSGSWAMRASSCRLCSSRGSAASLARKAFASVP